jgi:hypothetical protein
VRVTPSSNKTGVLGFLFEVNAMNDRLRSSYEQVGVTPRCDPSPSALAPRDPSRSCTDLQSIEPSSVAAGLASRLRLRPWLMWTLACSRRWSPRPGIDRDGSSHGLALSLRDRLSTSACASTGRRGPIRLQTSFHEVRRPFSAPTLESSLPGTRSAGRRAASRAATVEPAARRRLLCGRKPGRNTSPSTAQQPTSRLS